MSDRELELLRQKKLVQLRRQFEKKVEKENEKDQAVNPKEVLSRFFIGRAWEVFNAAKSQYPEAARQMESALVKLIMEGKLKSEITGEELYGLFLRLGLRVRLQTHIRVFEHGKIKSLEEKIKEETST